MGNFINQFLEEAQKDKASHRQPPPDDAYEAKTASNIKAKFFCPRLRLYFKESKAF